MKNFSELTLREIGAMIKKARLSKGWTQKELGKKSGYSRRTVQNWEKGEMPMGLDSFLRLTSLLDLPIRVNSNEKDGK